MREYTGQAEKARRAAGRTEASKGRVWKLKDQEYEKQDYRKYRMSVKEAAECILLYAGLDAAVSYLFFNSVAAFIILIPGFLLFLKEYKERLMKKRAEEMRREFLDGMQMTASSLQAGYSMENAFREALKELRKIYAADSFIVKEFRLLTSQVDMNQNAEALLSDLGRRSGIDDIKSLAEIVETAKRAGGDLILIIRNSITCMRQRQETMTEIDTCLAGKVMEQNIMSMIPILILAYVRLTSPEFLEAMYGNITGITVMLLCFLVYLAAVLWGRSIIQIEV